ncbi:MAG: dockerin type I domain-containing protein [Chthoniobacterales bacterium]
MKNPSVLFPLFAAVGAGFLFAPSATADVNVTQHHNHDSRDGLFVDPAFTSSNATNLTRDTNFAGTIVGNVYAQPLYVEGGPNNRAKILIVTESNNVYALDALDGSIIWQRNMGPTVTASGFNPLGITGTPVVDLASRALFFDSITTGPKRYLYSLNVDTGAINSGWPADLALAVPGFSASIQTQRAALGLAGGIVYSAYGGYIGDAGNYHGRLVGVQIGDPSSVLNWATTASKGGVWGPGGVATEGNTAFVTTGNTSGTNGIWGGGEAVIRLQAGPVFSGAAADYWAPTNWLSLDNSDTDLGGSGPLLVDVPGATPSALVVALGKDGNAYLLDRNNLGGITAPITSSHVGSGSIIQAAATYHTAQGTYVVFRANSATLTAFKITATSPPAIASAWTVSQSGRGSPFVTSTDGINNAIVWVVGAEGDNRLHGYNGDTGVVVYAGGGTNELMSGTRRWNTGIAARGRIYFAADNTVYAFQTPNAPPTPSSAVSRKTHTGAGDFDIPLPLTGTPGIECRSGGATNDYTVVVNFSAPVTVTGDTQATVTGGKGMIGTAGMGNGGAVTISGNSVFIPLTNMDSAQTYNINLTGVTDGSSYGNVVIPMSVLVGDVGGNGSVNSSDVAATKAAVGQPLATHFRADINTNGIVNSSDVAAVKAAVGSALP